MVSGTSDAPLGTPDGWDGLDGTDGYAYSTDSGFTDTVELIHFGGEPTMQPGEIWQFKLRLTLSSEPDSGGPFFIELRDEPSDNILARSSIPEFGGNETVLFATVPTYEVNQDASSPASDSARPDVRINNAQGDTTNWFAEMYAVRLRGPIDDVGRTQDELNASTDSLNSGQL